MPLAAALRYPGPQRTPSGVRLSSAFSLRAQSTAQPMCRITPPPSIPSQGEAKLQGGEDNQDNDHSNAVDVDAGADGRGGAGGQPRGQPLWEQDRKHQRRRPDRGQCTNGRGSCVREAFFGSVSGPSTVPVTSFRAPFDRKGPPRPSIRPQPAAAEMPNRLPVSQSEDTYTVPADGIEPFLPVRNAGRGGSLTDDFPRITPSSRGVFWKVERSTSNDRSYG